MRIGWQLRVWAPAREPDGKIIARKKEKNPSVTKD